MEEKEDRKDKREHLTVRLVAVLVFLVLVFTIGLTGLTTHETNMQEMANQKAAYNRCVDIGWHPVACRKAIDWNWELKGDQDDPKVVKKKVNR